MPAKYTNRRQRRHKKRQRKTQKRGGEEAKPTSKGPAAPAPVPTTTPYILVQCSLDGNATRIFKRDDTNIGNDSQLKGKYLFKIIDIKKADEKQITPLKKRGIFKQYFELGDISNIVFKGKIVPSSYIKIKSDKSDIIVDPIEIEFKFVKSKFYKDVFNIKTIPDPVVGDIAATNKYKLSNFKYIPRKWDVFEGDLNKKFITKFPNVKQKEAEKPEIKE